MGAITGCGEKESQVETPKATEAEAIEEVSKEEIEKPTEASTKEKKEDVSEEKTEAGTEAKTEAETATEAPIEERGDVVDSGAELSAKEAYYNFVSDPNSYTWYMGQNVLRRTGL